MSTFFTNNSEKIAHNVPGGGWRGNEAADRPAWPSRNPGDAKGGGTHTDLLDTVWRILFFIFILKLFKNFSF